MNQTITEIVEQSVKDIADTLDCSDTRAEEIYAHEMHNLTMPKSRFAKPRKSHRSPTYQEMTYDEAIKKYRYNPETGNLYYKHNGYKFRTDKEAFWLGNGDKRKMVYHNGLNYFQSRVIWLIHHGHYPNEIKYTNGNKQDDRIENLESVGHSASCQNHKPKTDEYIQAGKDIEWLDDTFGIQPPQKPIQRHANIDGGIMHHDGKKPWYVFSGSTTDTVKGYGSYFTIAEAYAVWLQTNK